MTTNEQLRILTAPIATLSDAEVAYAIANRSALRALIGTPAIAAALQAVNAASDDLRDAQMATRRACAALLALSPFKVGEDIMHGRYGKCRIARVAVKPHPEHTALWEITASPYLKTGKPGARCTSWLERITPA